MALLRKLRRNLADLIDPESDRQRDPRRRQMRRVRFRRSCFYDRIRILVPAGRDPSAKTGQVNLISIAPIREHLGNQWAHYADRIARNAIERYLLGGDIYARWKDEGYIVVFATLNVHQAQIKCKLIGDEIAHKLFGEDARDLADIYHVEVEADGAVTFSPVPRFDDMVTDHHPGGRLRCRCAGAVRRD